MSKFVLKNDSQQEVKIGDSITATRKTEFGTVTVTRTITEDVLKELIDSGIVIELNNDPKKEEVMNIFNNIIKEVETKLNIKLRSM